MIGTSALFSQKIAESSRQFRARLLYEGAAISGEIRNITINKGACGESFSIGSIYSPYIEVTLDKCEEILENKELLLQIGLVIDDTVEYIDMGYYTVTKPNRSTYQTTFTAVGRITSKLNALFDVPAVLTLSNIANAITAATGVTITFNGEVSDAVLVKDITGMTCKEALSVIAGTFGGFATEDNSGNIVVSKYNTDSKVSVDEDRMTSLPEFNDYDYELYGVKVIVSAEGEDEDGNVIEEVAYTEGSPRLTVNNEFMTADLFESFVANTEGYTYRPGTVPLALGDPRLQPWDCLEVTDVNGNVYVVPCLNIVHTFDGGLTTTITAPGESESESGSSVAGPISQQIERLNYQLITAQEAIFKRLKADDLEAEVAKLGYASVKQLEAVNANIENLNAKDAEITGKLTANDAAIENLKAKDTEITGQLTAANADITNLKAKNAEIEGTLTAATADIINLKAKDAEIEGTLTATTADITNLKAKDAEIEGTLKAAKAEITDLKAKAITTDNLSAKVATLGYATVDELEVTEGKIDDLTAIAITTDNLSAKVGEFGYLKAKDLESEVGKFGYLKADDLEAEVGEFGYLKADDLEAEVAEFGYAKATDLEATNLTVSNLSGEVATFKTATAENFSAVNVRIDDTLETFNAVILDLDAKDAEIENLVADNLEATNAEIESLQAEDARIEGLFAGYATVGDLNATNADIEVLAAGQADFEEATAQNFSAVNASIEEIAADYITTAELDAESAEIQKLFAGYATVDNLSATNANVTNLTTRQANFENATAQNFTSVNAAIDNIKADYVKTTDLEAESADIRSLFADYATVSQLNATNGNITTLSSTVAEINSAYMDEAEVESLVAGKGYLTEAQVNTLVVGKGYFTEAQVNNLVAGKGYITTAETNTLLSDYVKTSTLTADYIKASDIASTYATIKNLDAQKARIDTIVSDYVKTDILEANYITSSDISSTYATIANLNALNTTVNTLSSKSITTDNLSAQVADLGYLKADTASTTYATIVDLDSTNAAIDNLDATYATVDLANVEAGSITQAMIGNGVIGTAQIADGSITDAKIVGLTANKITAGKLDAGVIEVVNLNAANITVGTINGQQIASGAIDTSKLTSSLSSTITTASSNASQAITDAANAQDAADKAQSAAAGAQSTADSAVEAAGTAQTTADGKNTVFYQASEPSTSGRKTNDIWFDTDDGNKMYYWNETAWTAKQFSTSAIAASAITAEKVASGAITAAKIAANTITANEIAANAITAGTIAADAVTTEKIASGAVVADSIASSAITADKIVAGAVTTDKIAANAVTGDKILAGEITANHIETGTITATQIASGSITVDRLDADELKARVGSYGYLEAEELSAEVAKLGYATADELEAAVGRFSNYVLISDYSTDKSALESSISGAQSTANSANTAAGNAQTKADSAYTLANTANSTANSADSKATEANSVLAKWCYNNNTTYIDGGNIYTGTIAAEAINADTLSAITADLGTVTAGVIQSENFAMSDFSVSIDYDGREVITGGVTSGLKIDLDNKAFYTPHVTMKDNYIFLNGYMTIGTRGTGDIGIYSFTQGSFNVASGYYSHAEGAFATASERQAHAEGAYTTASGSQAHAEGVYTTASGDRAHAEGSNSTASGRDSHAEGENTTASGEAAHSEGFYAFATGKNSHAEGYRTTASGAYSHAEGTSTVASSSSQHVQGRYNIEDADGIYAHIVGNGNGNVPSNAHTLDWSGNAWYAGDVIAGGTQATDGTVSGGASLLNDTAPLIIGTQTAATGSWRGVAPFKELRDGQTIRYWLPYNGSGNATLNLTLSDGTTTGAINCYLKGYTRLSTHYQYGSMIIMTYRENANVNGTNYTGWWAHSDYDSNTYTSAFCTTAAATAAKTASCSNFTLAAKSYLHVLIRYANTSETALTLNVNSTGAKPIYINGSASSTSNYTLPAGTYIVYYDGTNYYFRTDGVLTASITGNAATATKATQDGDGNVISSTYSKTGHTHSEYALISDIPAAYTHPSYTARTGVPTANATLTFGGTFTVSQPVSDATGHITAINSRTYTMPSDRLFTTLVPTGTAISTTGTDLNQITYIKVGRYYCSANATAKTLVNCPTSLAFMMEVYSPLSTTIDNESTGTYVYRLRKLTEYSTGKQYIQYVASGATAGTFTYNSWYAVPIAPFTLDTSDSNDGSGTVGSTTTPVYLNDSVVTACSTYAGGTAVTLNGSSKAASTASFYAPTAVGTSGNVLVSAGSGAPTWKSLADAGIAASGHTHSYLPLSGGTLTGELLISTGTTQSATKGIKWSAINSKNPYIGYATDQTDGTFVVGSLLGTNYASGLAIGGGSGNLLWKGAKVATATDLAGYATTGHTHSGYAKKENGVYYIAGTGSTEGTWLGSHDEITEYYDGLTILYKVGIAGVSGGTTLNINSLGAIAVMRNASSAVTTHYGVNSVVLLTYTTDDGTGYWKIADYDANNYAYVRQYYTTANGNYPLLSKYDAGITTTTSYVTKYSRYSNKFYINPSTGVLTAPTFSGALDGNATSATKATQDGDGNVISSTYSKTTHTHNILHYTNGTAVACAEYDTAASWYYFRPYSASANPVTLGSEVNPWYKLWTERIEITEGRIVCPATYNNTVSSATNMYVSSSGTISRTTSTSSRTIKHDIESLSAEDIKAENLYRLPVHQFKYNEGIITDKSDVRYMKNLPGFIIEEMNDVYPIAVDKPGDDVKEWSWNPQYMIPPMLKLIQEQHKVDIYHEGRIARAEAQIETLQEQLSSAMITIAKQQKEIDSLRQAS